jgi:formamidase
MGVMTDANAQVAQEEVVVERYTRGLIGPSLAVEQTVKSGGRIRAVTPPGCWGPMITPSFQGGHEVSWPVAVEGAAVGDSIAITIERVRVVSAATSSGTMVTKEAAFGSDPFVDKKCPNCGVDWPDTTLDGVGEDAVRCAACGSEASAFAFEEGYTIAFDHDHGVGVTVDQRCAHEFSLRASEVAGLPPNSEQIPILTYAPSAMPGTLARLRPFIGNIGTSPSRDLPDSHNAGDFGSFLVGADHRFALTEAELDEHRTDGHLDCDSVREGAVLIVPVKVPGGGIYMGDAHANQGDGELALHTTDITAEIQVRVDLLKGVEVPGPLLLPVVDDLPSIARPFSAEEREAGRALGSELGVEVNGRVAPVQVIGTAGDLNAAAENAIDRASSVFGMSRAEVRNRATITGAVEIARFPGAVQLSMLTPLDRIDDAGLGDVVRRQYGLDD